MSATVCWGFGLGFVSYYLLFFNYVSSDVFMRG